jgi:hypothetical protein
LYSSDTCRAAEEQVEVAWNQRAAWRQVTPYPAPRQVAPTDSVGVWLERWELANGDVALRRVSAAETIVTEVQHTGCAISTVSHKRRFASPSPEEFGDEDLSRLLRSTASGMIYIWSPRMPLAVRGIAEARAAARELGIAFTALATDAANEDTSSRHAPPSGTRLLESVDLVYRGATLHYPSAIFYRNGAIDPRTIPGYKDRSTYASLFRDGERTERAPGIPGAAVPKFWIDRAARFDTLRSVQTSRLLNSFFKPVGSTHMVTYTSRSQGYLLNLDTRIEQRLPGYQKDPAPTPDGRLITVAGLQFFNTGDLAVSDTVALFRDPTLPGDYQSVALTKTTASNRWYRVLTAWKGSVQTREYRATFDGAGHAHAIEPVGAVTTPCPQRLLSLPMSARAGHLIAACDVTTQSQHIVRVTADECADTLDLGFATGKVSFSYDGASIAFSSSRINVDAEGPLFKPDEMFYRDAFLLEMSTGRLVVLSDNRSIHGSMFPEFVPEGNVVVLDWPNAARPITVIRLLRVTTAEHGGNRGLRN